MSKDNSKPLTVGNIIIGDEILKGYVKETNSHFLAKQLFPKGIQLERILILPDEEEIIAKSVAEFSEKYDFVVTSGGIGPTHDDITFDSVAKAFNEKFGKNLTGFKFIYRKKCIFFNH